MSSPKQNLDAEGIDAGDALHEASAAPVTARPVTRPIAVRLWATLVLVGCLAVLGLALYLAPAPRGYGTHEALFGTGPCGMLVMTGLPCPTCGMTTSFSHVVRGQWLRAFYVQPAGFMLALGTIALVVICIWTLIRGHWPLTTFWLINPYRIFLALLVLLVGGWAFKIATGLADGSLPYPGAYRRVVRMYDLECQPVEEVARTPRTPGNALGVLQHAMVVYLVQSKGVKLTPFTRFIWGPCKRFSRIERSTSGPPRNGTSCTSSRCHTSRDRCDPGSQPIPADDGERAYQKYPSISFPLADHLPYRRVRPPTHVGHSILTPIMVQPHP